MDALGPEQITAFRKAHSLTQEALATALGTSRRTVQDWEAGTNRSPPMLRLAFAAIVAELEPWPAP